MEASIVQSIEKRRLMRNLHSALMNCLGNHVSKMFLNRFPVGMSICLLRNVEVVTKSWWKGWVQTIGKKMQPKTRPYRPFPLIRKDKYQRKDQRKKTKGKDITYFSPTTNQTRNPRRYAQTNFFVISKETGRISKFIWCDCYCLTIYFTRKKIARKISESP